MACRYPGGFRVSAGRPGNHRYHQAMARSPRARILWDIDTAAPGASLQFLNELGAHIGRRSILIATSDIGAIFVAEHADRLAKWFLFPMQDRDLIRSLCSKREMYHLAKKWNI